MRAGGADLGSLFVAVSLSVSRSLNLSPVGPLCSGDAIVNRWKKQYTLYIYIFIEREREKERERESHRPLRARGPGGPRLTVRRCLTLSPYFS